MEKTIEKRIEVPVLKNGQLDKATALVERIHELASKAGELVPASSSRPECLTLARPASSPARSRWLAIYNAPESRTLRKRLKIHEHAEPPHSDASGSGSPGRLPIGEQKTLAACIQYPHGLYRNQLTVLTGYKRSTRDAYIARLREKGFTDQAGEKIIATDAGRAALPDCEALPTGRALQEYWLARLPEGERKILEVLIQAHPEAVARADLDELTGYKRSTRDAYISRLESKELVVSERGEVRASDELFG